MPTVRYLGPADTVELDGLVVKKNEPIELTAEQIGRVAASDPEARVEPVDDDHYEKED